MTAFLYLTAFLLAGCGLVREPLAPPPSLFLTPSKTAECTEDQFNVKDTKNLDETLLHNAILCIERKILTAFNRVRGQFQDELTLGEIRVLVHKKFLTLPLTQDHHWKLVEEALRLTHKAGEPRLSRDTIVFVFSWLKQNESTLLKIFQRDPGSSAAANLIFTLRNQLLEEAWHPLFDLISPSYRLTRERALALIHSIPKNHFKSVPSQESSPNDIVEALWILKSFFFEDTFGQGARGDLTGAALKKLLNLSYDLMIQARSTHQWGINLLTPDTIPADLEKEWKVLGSILEGYFTQNSFAEIDSASLYWALKKLAPKTQLASLSQDLIRLSQRLSSESNIHEGLHPVALIPFTKITSLVAEDLKVAAMELQKHKTQNDWGPSFKITLRDALQHPLLKKVALKGPINQIFNGADGKSQLPKRLDKTLRWHEVVGRLGLRQIFLTLFNAFDSQTRKAIPISSDNEDELKDVLDLAYTFLRFATKTSKELNPKTGREESVPNHISIKPTLFAKVMGLIGDEWMTDGNGDGYLNAEEFFSITQVYEAIQEGANYSLWNTAASSFRKLPSGGPSLPNSLSDYLPIDQRIYRRSEFISHFPKALGHDFLSQQLLTAMPEALRHSLLHALIGKRKGNEIDAIQVGPFFSNTSETPIKMANFVTSDSSLAPMAVLELIQRLMIRCDVNEDDELSWKELDCALPLVLRAAHQTVSSDIIDLDPGVHDASVVLTSLLQTKGLPLSVAKLVAVNGSIKRLRLEGGLSQLKHILSSSVKLDWADLGRFLMGTEQTNLSPFTFEAQRRFGNCDFDENNVISGSEELKCFSEKILESVLQSLHDLLKTSVSNQSVQEILQGYDWDLLQSGFVLSALPDEQSGLILNQLNLKCSPKKILLLLEEVIRRAQPLEEVPE